MVPPPTAEHNPPSADTPRTATRAYELPPPTRLRQPEPEQLRQAAIYYARKGIPVFPVHGTVEGVCTCRAKDGCTRPGKHPRTRHGFKDATTDANKVAEWWEKWPHANIGIPTGKASGLLVLDVDFSPRAAAPAWYVLALKHGFPATCIVRTGSDGRHMYFRYPKRRVIPNSTGKLGAGLDVRGEGGYVIAPPSETTGTYQPLVRKPISDAPNWLLEALTDKSRTAENKSGNKSAATQATPIQPTGFFSAAGPPIPEHTRNETLASIAGRLHDGTRDLKQLTTDLLAVNEARCQPPLPEPEVRKIARSYITREECRAAKNEVPEEVREFVQRHRAQILEGRPWPGRSGPTDQDGYEALLDLAEKYGQPSESGNVVVCISVRDFAMRAGIHEDTACKKCLPRLQKAHLLYRRPKRTGPGVAGEIVLRNVATQATPIQPTVLGKGADEYLDEARLRSLLRRARHGASVSKADARVVRGLLMAGGEATPLEVSTLLRRGRGCDIRRNFRKLEALGVVQYLGGDTRSGADRWRVADDLVAAIEAAAGDEMKEREEKQRERNRKQRERYADQLELRRMLFGLTRTLEDVECASENDGLESGSEWESAPLSQPPALAGAIPVNG
jgi:Bifunctional DNA primase/polymerase, N-terminal/Primase C terminal 1 (PriCT-1)